jgi:hypothetical protein
MLSGHSNPITISGTSEESNLRNSLCIEYRGLDQCNNSLRPNLKYFDLMVLGADTASNILSIFASEPGF